MIKQTELILQAAAKQVTVATSSLQKVMTELAKNVELIEVQNQQIAQHEAKIDELQTQYDEKKRQAELDLMLSLKEMEKLKIQEILAENELSAIKNDELNELRTELTKLKSNFDTEMKKIESTAKGEATAKIEAAKNIFELQKRAEIAEINGKLNSASEKMTMLEAQLKNCREEITAMRNAETERVKAISGKDVVINTGNNNR